MLGSSISKFFKLDNLMANLTGYVETKVELIKVELKEDLAQGLAHVINYLIIAFVFALVIFFVSLGVAIVLSKALGDFWGYGIVALFYLIIGLILLGNRNKLNSNLEKKISKQLNRKK
jgi:uncharacterized membrane protein YqjE